jgi:uncharacterized protein
MKKVPLRNIEITDNIWSYYMKLTKDVVIPYQWEALNDRIEDAAPSGVINNLKIAAGEKKGEFVGMVFQDSDIGKWLEAVAYSLQWNPNKELEAIADDVIELLSRAQGKDGYLNTYFTVKEPGKRWTNLWECHELYCFGHLAEAAVAYYEATNKSKFLDIICKYADYIYTIFGEEQGKIRGYDGHEEAELALIKLYKVTANENYLKLADYFIEERGKEPYYFSTELENNGGISHWSKQKRAELTLNDKKYNQAHRQPKYQDDIEGHAVRAVYLATAMADLALVKKDEELLNACKRLWNSMTKRRMYITGAIGSSRFGEAFTFDYDLPNDTAYAETCASIGLIFFANRMLQIEPNNEYADTLDLALYNTVLAGMSLDGRSFFYVNPLEVLPEACEKNLDFEAVKPIRQKWFGCACCPPNVARLLTSLGEYIYSVSENTIYNHLYIANKSDLEVNSSKVTLEQIGNYPFDNKVEIKVDAEKPTEFTLALRIPKWSKNTVIKVNDEIIKLNEICDKGYVKISKVFKQDIISITFDLEVRAISSNPKVKSNAGKIAVMRGPIVYCLEEVDNGKNLHAISVYPEEGFLLEENNSLPLKVPSIVANRATKPEDSIWEDTLYNLFEENNIPAIARFVPYFIWGNRNDGDKAGEMLVWTRYHI